MTSVHLDGHRLVILRQSSSTVGRVHAAWIDLATGATGCSDTCHARGKRHKHTAELEGVRAAFLAFMRVTGMRDFETMLRFSRTFKVQNGMDTDFLQYQCGQHPHPTEPKVLLPAWNAPDTLVYQAAKLILADRAALVAQNRKYKEVAA